MTVPFDYTTPTSSPRYVPSETADRFIRAVASPAAPKGQLRLLILMGSRGEGKTTAGLWSIVALSRQVLARDPSLLPIKVGVVRDLWVNLVRTTLESFEESRRKGVPIRFFDDRRQAMISVAGRPVCHFYFFGLDRPEDADKLQGFQCAVLWLEEVAPAAGIATGVPSEALGLGATSVRQAGVPHRILVTMNPPDQDHWILRVENYLGSDELSDVLVERFEFVPGEKARHFSALAAEADTPNERAVWTEAAIETEAYNRRNRMFLESIGRTDLVSRLVEGQIAGVDLGEKVVPTFCDLHVAKDGNELEFARGYPVFRCWDPGGTPSTVWFQVIDTGRGSPDVNILGSRTSVNKGMAQHILDEVLPFQQHYSVMPKVAAQPGGFGRPAKTGYLFRDIGDPSCFKPSEANSEESAGLVIEQMLGTTLEPGPVAWSARREALHAAFFRAGAGSRARMILIDPDENQTLIAALRGRAYYPVHRSTNRIDFSVEAMKRVSGLYAQALDALAYGLAVRFPAEDWLKKAMAAPAPSVRRPQPTSWLGV